MKKINLRKALTTKPRFGLLALGLTLLAGIIGGGVFMPTQPVNGTAATCPEGTYLIGYAKDDESVPMCKPNPTGCPYGDSIPLDMCDKFAPEQQPEKDQNDLPDADRPYYDADGNKYDYKGNLIEAAPVKATTTNNCSDGK